MLYYVSVHFPFCSKRLFLCTDTPHFTYSSVGRHLGCFPFSGILNNAALNIDVQGIVWILFIWEGDV
jgi:hypothetical protein